MTEVVTRPTRRPTTGSTTRRCGTGSEVIPATSCTRSVSSLPRTSCRATGPTSRTPSSDLPWPNTATIDASHRLGLHAGSQSHTYNFPQHNIVLVSGYIKLARNTFLAFGLNKCDQTNFFTCELT